MQKISKSNKLPELPFLGLKEENGISYSQKTGNVNITVWPEFVGDQRGALGNLFIWAYHIKIDNLGDENVQLISRRWKIIDEQGLVQEVEGEGVVGLQPQILPHNSFKYSSGVHLNLPSGIMSGVFEMKKDNGEKFEVQVPSFSLDSNSTKKSIN